MIRLARPSIDHDDVVAVARVLESGMLVQGAVVRRFEEEIARRIGVLHAVALSSCTAALHLALRALGIGPRDRVATSAFSWPATANAIALNGAEPVFVDIDPATYNLDPNQLERVLAAADGERVKAVLPVHAFGLTADMTRIGRIAAAHRIPVIEDAACALGAKHAGRPAGAFGAIGCFSFHPRKAITTGEGGMIVTSDAVLARQIRVARNHGLDPDAPSPDFVEVGFNLRMTELQAALGVSQLAKLDRLLERRRAIAAEYDRAFANSVVTAPRAAADTPHSYQSYVVLLPRGVEERRPELIARLLDRGIEVTIGTHHVPLTRFYRTRGGYARGRFPVTDDIAARALSLPLHEHLDAADPAHVAEVLLEELD